MTISIKKIGFVVSIVGAMMLPTLANAEIVFVVNDTVNATEISKKEAKKIFLGTKKEFGGVNVKVVGLSEGNNDREAFISEVLGMSADQLSKHWIDEGLKGGARPPKSLKTAGSLINYIKKKKNSIGYLNKTMASGSGLKILTIK